MAVLSLPAALLPQDAVFRLRGATLAHTSDLDGTTQTVRLPGQHWGLEVSLPAKRRIDAEPWLAFLAELDGRAGRFYAGDPADFGGRGNLTGSTPLVDGADQTGASLDVKGLALGQTGVFLVGDYFALDLPAGGRSLHMVVGADVDADGGGLATIAIRPRLREAPANEAPLITTAPTCVMMLIDDNQAEWPESVGTGPGQPLYHIAFAAVEAFTLGES